MHYLVFELTGELAMWRNPYESMGSFSCLGPAPSNIAGIIGAALGFASPRSQAAAEPNEKALKEQAKGGLPWPVSPELLQWQKDNEYHVACRWTGGFPKRLPWNVNGLKDPSSNTNLRIQQQVIENPSYEVALKLSLEVATRVADALRTPAFPLFLGASFCPAIVKKVRVQENRPEGNGWAYQKSAFAVGEATPLSRHVINADECFERIQADGYWVYPTPLWPGEQQPDPFIRGYCEVELAKE